MVNIGIIGGAGYTGGELIRILLNHPEAKISFVHSKSNFGKKIYEVHTDLIGETQLIFSEINYNKVDLIFLCMGHGRSKEFVLKESIPNHIKIIDLSHDFRLKAEGNNFVYGLPELNKEQIKQAKYIANPGCFATAIELAILPLAYNRLLTDDVHVNGITGSTGAGQKLSPTSHYSWRNNNVSIYKAFQHQHLKEINQSIKQLQHSFNKEINFIPIRGNFTRGILISAYTKCDKSEDEVYNIYEAFYKNHPFVIITKTNSNLKQIVNTNKCVLQIIKHENKVLITSVTDNLIKGASGQALQNMNLMFGLPEDMGLKLKSAGF